MAQGTPTRPETEAPQHGETLDDGIDGHIAAGIVDALTELWDQDPGAYLDVAELLARA